MEDDWNDLDLSGLKLSTRTQKSDISFNSEAPRHLGREGPANRQVVDLHNFSEKDGLETKNSLYAKDLKTPPRQYGKLFQHKESPNSGTPEPLRVPLTSPPQAMHKTAQKELQHRLQQGLQPRRHVPSPSRVDAITAWQHRTQAEEGEDLEGIEIPLASHLVLHPSRKAVEPQFESDDEIWAGGSLGIRHASKARSNRQSTSSMLSSSNLSTDESQDGFEGLELPVDLADLRQRFKQNADRRAAGDTIRHVRKPNYAEDHGEGLVIDHDSFVKNNRFSNAAARCRQSGLPISSRLYTSKVRDDSRQKEASVQHNNAKPTLQNSSTARQERHTSNVLSTPVSNTAAAKADARVSAAQLRAKLRKPAFLPSGISGDNSYHVSARDQRTTGATARIADSPSKRRATASEALRLEATRCSARAHIRAKTYGEGHELDSLDDLPLESTPVSHKPSVTFTPQTEKLQKYQERRRKPHVVAGSGTAQTTRLAVSQARQRISDATRPGTTTRTDRAQRKNVVLPGLISGINAAPTAKREKNMVYNPKTFRWEGNEQDMYNFDTVLQSPPRPALIAQVSNTLPTVQVSNGMVFDPQQMRWVKLSDDESEVDPFEALSDMDDERPGSATTPSKTVRSSASEAVNHFTIGEEFDVGRQFIRKQREEEVRWRRQAQGWFTGRRPGMSRQYLQEIYMLLTEDE